MKDGKQATPFVTTMVAEAIGQIDGCMIPRPDCPGPIAQAMKTLGTP
jgi:hypothetical protein